MTDDLAARILQRFGASIDRATRPDDGVSNDAWMTDEIVVRIASGFDPGYLSREARLGPLLPAEVGYPRVLGSGVEDGREWMVSERIPGSNLERVWPSLDDASRVAAVESLWHRLDAVHRTDVGLALDAGCVDSPFYALDSSAAVDQLDRLEAERAIDATMRAGVQRRIEDLFAVVDGVERRVCHTDVGLGNAVWDGRYATPIDFEFACVAPEDLDLERWCWHVRDWPRDVTFETWRALADRDVTRPHARTRLIGYRTLRDVWAVGVWLRHAEAEGRDRDWPPQDIREWRPWRDLEAVASGHDPFEWLAGPPWRA